VDASKDAFGFALYQEINGVTKFLSFDGRATRKYEKSYSATLLELSALVQALITYNSLISNGLPITIKTDHVSLRYIQQLKNGPSKLVRFSLLLQQYNLNIVHVAGHAHQLADGLSRRPHESTEEMEAQPPRTWDKPVSILKCIIKRQHAGEHTGEAYRHTRHNVSSKHNQRTVASW